MSRIPAATDIRTLEPSPRRPDDSQYREYVLSVYQNVLINMLFVKQHRGVLVALNELDPAFTDLTELTQSISNPPTQAEVQAIQAKVNAIVASHNTLYGMFSELIAAAREKLGQDITIEGL